MLPDFDSRLRAMAEVIVRVGLNLQPGQPLLVTEPYELQGFHPGAGPLATAVQAAATGSEVTLIPADLGQLRGLAETDDRRGFEALVSGHVRRLEQHLARGGAFLFLLGSQPQLMAGLPADRLPAFDRIKWRHLGPLIQRLIRGASQWTLVPAPSPAWADAAYGDLAATDRLPALWETVFASLRIGTADPIGTWQAHLASLARRRDELNAARHRQVRYTGPDTHLVLGLPRSHVWCTAQLVSRRGVPFVVNLPTEEIFTAPDKSSAIGSIQVSRPVVHGGAVIEGIKLDFHHGKVVAGGARAGNNALQHLLDTDAGAGRIGEVAIVPQPGVWPDSARFFHHTLLDENAANHIALGDAYRFCSRAWLPLALNSSQVHLDLPLDATVELS